MQWLSQFVVNVLLRSLQINYLFLIPHTGDYTCRWMGCTGSAN